MSAPIQYPYALDEDGNLVFIGAVMKENRYDHEYHCPNCGGEMLPRLGEHNEHCFAHAGNQKCSGESYLHKAAKLLLARRFNERSKPFKIGLTLKRPCVSLATCQETEDGGHCQFVDYKEYDLTTFYDLPAEVEVDILEPDGETHFTPDAMLRSSSPRRDDIFIEVYYKHKVTKDKIASGHHIIELRIRELADLKALEETECFKESEDIVFYNFKSLKAAPEEIESYVRQLAKENGFLNYDSLLPPCKQSRETKRKRSTLRRLTLYKSGKIFEGEILEDDLDRHHPSALMDITHDASSGLWQTALLGVLAKHDIRARVCNLCEHYISKTHDEVYTVTWCKLIKDGSSRKGTFDPLKGRKCPFFKWHSNLMPEMEQIMANPEKYRIWTNPKANSVD